MLKTKHLLYYNKCIKESKIEKLLCRGFNLILCKHMLRNFNLYYKNLQKWRNCSRVDWNQWYKKKIRTRDQIAGYNSAWKGEICTVWYFFGLFSSRKKIIIQERVLRFLLNISRYNSLFDKCNYKTLHIRCMPHEDFQQLNNLNPIFYEQRVLCFKYT